MRLPFLLCIVSAGSTREHDSSSHEESLYSPGGQPLSPEESPKRWNVSFEGIAVLGLTPKDGHVQRLLGDLKIYAGITAAASIFGKTGKEGCLLKFVEEDVGRQDTLQSLGSFSRSMADAWIAALTSKNQLVMVAKTKADNDAFNARYLKVKIGHKFGADKLAERIPGRLPPGMGVSIVDIDDIESALVSKKAPQLKQHLLDTNWTTGMNSSDYDMESYTKADAASHSARASVTNLFWIVLHEVIVHDLLHLSHNYSPGQGRLKYDYNADEAMHQLSQWSWELGLPERLVHPSLFDRDDPFCLYLWIDPLHVEAFGTSELKGTMEDREKKYKFLRSELDLVVAQGAGVLQQPDTQAWISEHEAQLLWATFHDVNDMYKKPTSMKTHIPTAWLEGKLKALDTGSISVAKPVKKKKGSPTDQVGNLPRWRL